MPTLKESDSATARLYRIAVRIRAVGGASGSQLHVWARFFDLHSNNRTAILTRVGEMCGLVDLAAVEINSIEGIEHSTYLSGVQAMDTAFARIGLAEGWAAVYHHVTELVVNHLYFAADRVAWTAPRRIVAQEQREAIREKFASLLEEIKKSKLTARLRDLLISEIHVILTMIDRYDVLGGEGLENACKRAFGAMYFEQQEVLNAKDEPEVKGFIQTVKELGNLASAGSQLMTLAGDAVDFVKKLLPSKDD